MSYPGHQGNMPVGDFVGLIERNCTRQDFRVVYTRFGERSGLPPGTATLVWGDPYKRANDDHLHVESEGAQFNFSVPWMPERTMRKMWAFDGVKPKMRIWKTGWRNTIHALLRKKLVRPSTEIRKILGDQDYDIQRALWRGTY